MTALETIMFAYCILVAVVIVIQTIRLELARDTIAEREAQLARREVLSTPRCKSLAQCVKTHHLAEQASVPVEAVTPIEVQG